ncbi:MAG: hypothetical protein LBS90_05430 [Oscillospiraceae bacterium]|jgi:hypothetical protein|nr:hypothetical protein [Oscillospiraceae bacterium]
MTEKVIPGPVPDNTSVREAVSVHTKKIFDSCRDKDCIEDLRLYLTRESQRIVDNAVSVRAKNARLLYVHIDVEEVTFNRGYYAVDIRFYYKVRGEAYTMVGKPLEISGLTVFDKRVILFGSEGNAKIFTSKTVLGGDEFRTLEYNNLPTAVIEAVDPIVLGMRVYDVCDNNDKGGNWSGPNAPNSPAPYASNVGEVPDQIHETFGGDLFFEAASRHIYVTLGQFSIVRLERDTQLLMPSYDYFVPQKECIGGGEDDACSLFSKIKFPVDEFFPPDSLEPPEGYREAKSITCDK